ncbi:MAG: hypothetical protein Kow006_18080 [Gammaproteobacteria bacterium]
MSGNDREHSDETISEDDLKREMERDPQFEAFLKEAAHIPVPEGLADRILAKIPDDDHDDAAASSATVISLDRAREQQEQQKATVEKRHRWVARAASVLLLVGLLGVSYFARDPGQPPSQVILADLQSALPTYDAMVVSRQVDPNIEANLHRMLETIGAKRVGNLSDVIYCETTTVAGNVAGVMVFPGEKGAVTVVFVTDRKINERSAFAERGLEGVIWPDRKGSIAVIGQSGEPEISRVEERVRSAVSWF